MKPAEIAILKEWVKEGAVYRPHWAFDKPIRPAVPTIEQKDAWGKTPIDAFILARLKREGLHPSPEADKATLIRRVTLDLTGLLPTPAEVRAFQNNASPQAYEHLVDGLLARPTFGEERTRYWLDYARYADTYGLHYDNSRDIWPYRDYLIRSFNRNKPFDQFAMEQIAGDLLPAKNLDPLIASGYVRPSQVDLWDYKPSLAGLYDKDIPDSVRGAQQLTGMTANQARFPVAPSHWSFKRYGETGIWVSDLLPYTGRMADDLAIIKSTNTEAINHEPAIMLMNTGNMNAGKPCLARGCPTALAA